MEVVYVWLIYNKASMTLDSPMNLDGSDYMLGIGVVPATNMKEAITLFEAYLKTQNMELMELTKCEQFSVGNFDSQTLEDREIREAASESLETNKIYYVCGVSSEALDCEQGE